MTKEYQKRPATVQAHAFITTADISSLASLIKPKSPFDPYVAKLTCDLNGGCNTLELIIDDKSYKFKIGDYVVRSADGIEIVPSMEFHKRFIPFNSYAYPETCFTNLPTKAYPGGIGPETSNAINNVGYVGSQEYQSRE